jgi:hypothetical protein
MGRIGHFLATALSNSDEKTILERAKLANAALFLLRGGPVLYYGDEKGMTGSGGDKNARQDMFQTQVLDWQNELRIGSIPIKNASAFSIRNPLEDQITELQKLILAKPGLRSGNQEVVYAKGSIFAVTRNLRQDQYLVALNGGDSQERAEFSAGPGGSEWKAILGNCQNSVSTEIKIEIPARSYCVYERKNPQKSTGQIKFSNLKVRDTGLPSGWREISTQLTGINYAEVTFNVRAKGKNWTAIGTSDRRTFATERTKGGLYRVYLHPEDFKKGSTIEIIAAAADEDKRVHLSKVVKVKI